MEPRARLRLRVAPGSRRAAVVGRHGDAWKLRVTQPAERGAANEAVTMLLARTLDVERGAVRVVAGRASRDKVVELEGITTDEAERRLTAGSEAA